MPRTKFQSFIFSLMMVFCMVFCMTVYTNALQTGSLEYSTFLTAIREMWIEFIIVFVLIFFFITKAALKLTNQFVNPKTNNPLASTLATQSFTVAMIVPLITLIATFLHNGPSGAWFVQWLTTAAQCFPAAYILQIFYIGPLVRLLFRKLFAKQLDKEEPAAQTSQDNRAQNNSIQADTVRD